MPGNMGSSLTTVCLVLARNISTLSMSDLTLEATRKRSSSSSFSCSTVIGIFMYLFEF